MSTRSLISACLGAPPKNILHAIEIWQCGEWAHKINWTLHIMLRLWNFVNLSEIHEITFWNLEASLKSIFHSSRGMVSYPLRWISKWFYTIDVKIGIFIRNTPKCNFSTRSRWVNHFPALQGVHWNSTFIIFEKGTWIEAWVCDGLGTLSCALRHCDQNKNAHKLKRVVHVNQLLKSNAVSYTHLTLPTIYSV